jgi:hypothetical protein
MDMHEYFGKAIYSYGRTQAIKDGYLKDVTSMFPDATRIFKYPVAITKDLWDLIEGKNASTWVKDICSMAALYKVMEIDPTTIITKCNLPTETGSEKTKCFTLKSKCEPGDNFEPVITISIFKHQ